MPTWDQTAGTDLQIIDGLVAPYHSKPCTVKFYDSERGQVGVDKLERHSQERLIKIGTHLGRGRGSCHLRQEQCSSVAWCIHMDTGCIMVWSSRPLGCWANKHEISIALNIVCWQDVHDFALRIYVLRLYTQSCSKTASQLLLDVLETLVEKNLESPRYIDC